VKVAVNKLLTDKFLLIVQTCVDIS